MRTLLIADDERIIREGIANAVDWESLGISGVLLASDGKAAYETIINQKPDIVIIDIKMPEMTGIEVISRIKQKGFGPEFIILSGYGEFDYAQEAIRNNVRNYILKPCNICEITESIRKIVENMEQDHAMELERLKWKRNFDLLLPQACEHLFREYITGLQLSEDNNRILHEVFRQYDGEFQLMIFSSGDLADYSMLTALKKSIDAIPGIHIFRFSTILQGSIVLVFAVVQENDPGRIASHIRMEASKNSTVCIRAAASSTGGFDDLPDMYGEALEAVKFAFYSDDNEQTAAATYIDASAPRRCKTIRQVIQYVHGHYNDSSLSLGHIAADVLYLNQDYLGKLFKKECGVKFTDYLVSVRIEKARQIIMHTDDFRVYEIAQQVGLGDNSAYFSSLFRKYTGMLPSEYRSKHLSRAKL
jgi:two-component system response regulator YesN